MIAAYQVRHKMMGLYQGSFIGLGFWWPMSEVPEQGLCRFPTLKDAQDHVDFLCSAECAAPLNKDDFEIETFDDELNGLLIKCGEKNCLEKGHSFC